MSDDEAHSKLLTQSKAFIHDIRSPLLIAHTYVTETWDQLKNLLNDTNSSSLLITPTDLQIKLKEYTHWLEQGLIALNRLEKLNENFKTIVLTTSS